MPLTPDQRSVLMNEGAFRGLRTLIARGSLTETAAKDIVARTYKTILEEVKEARKELIHIQTALTALENAARLSSQSLGSSLADRNYEQMTHHLITFDAWVVSLLETDLTITGLLNPGHTRNKITELSNALNALMDKRSREQHPVLDDPNLFRGYIDR